MHSTFRTLLASIALSLVACAGPSEDDCRAACEEAASACTDDDVVDKCVDRCQENADQEQVDDAKESCGGYSTCSLGLCCSGFYYDESDKELYCSG